MSTIENAIIIATNVHAGQIDKGGNPYILHPLRVMLAVKGSDEMMAAVLHDVLEDSEMKASDLMAFMFSNAVIDAVVALTRNDGESYSDFISRVAKNEIATAVKIADLTDNLDLSRIKEPTKQDIERHRKYVAARAELIRSVNP